MQKRVRIVLKIEKPWKGEWINNCIKKIPYNKSLGYAGYQSRDALKKFLRFSIFGSKQVLWKQPDEKELKKSIQSAIKCCKPILFKKLTIFVFPTVNEFIVKKMGGVSGFTPWKNVIVLNVYPGKQWKREVRNTVVHEASHAMMLNIQKPSTVMDDLVFEGIAEHVREELVSGGKTPWITAISKKEAKDIFNEIKDKIGYQNRKLSKDLFFGTGKYPLWAGYTIGYHLVEEYLKKTKKNWLEIMRQSSKKIVSQYRSKV
jgi:uncharacterized protein YjaZ